MDLEILEGKKEVGAAYNQFFKNLTKGTAKFNDRTIIYKPDSHTDTAYWNTELNYYGMFVPLPKYNQYWCSFGVDSPVDNERLHITVQLTFNTKGIKRTFGGMFLRDGSGRIYVGHKGKIGGGVEGLNQDVFWTYFGYDSAHTAFWSDGTNTDVYVIGSIKDKNLQAQIGKFVYDVHELKKEFNEGIQEGTKSTVETEDDEHGFSSEHIGPRAPYDVNNTVHANSYHGLVVDELKDILENQKYKVANDVKRDLYIYNKRKRVTVLFEVKTTLDTTSMYAAIGQLMLNSAKYTTTPKMVAVFPGEPKENTEKAFNKLGIGILRYKWKNEIPIFANLDDVL